MHICLLVLNLISEGIIFFPFCFFKGGSDFFILFEIAENRSTKGLQGIKFKALKRSEVAGFKRGVGNGRGIRKLFHYERQLLSAMDK